MIQDVGRSGDNGQGILHTEETNHKALKAA